MSTLDRLHTRSDWAAIRKMQDDFDRDESAPDPDLSQEIIYDESGIEIGATGRLQILDADDHDPRNTSGKNL